MGRVRARAAEGRVKHRAPSPPDAADLGPALRRERGDVLVDVRPTEGKRARRADPLVAIRAAGGLGHGEDAHRRQRAAERLRDMADDAQGIRGEQAPKVDGTPDRTALLPVERHLHAKAAYSAAWQAIGPTYSGVVQWVVIGWGSLSGFAETKHMGRDTAAEWLRAGLDRIP